MFHQVLAYMAARAESCVTAELGRLGILIHNENRIVVDVLVVRGVSVECFKGSSHIIQWNCDVEQLTGRLLFFFVILAQMTLV